MILRNDLVIAASVLMFVFSINCNAQTQTYSKVKTERIEVAGTHFSYRKYGPAKNIPLVLLMHTRGNMDGWDPALLDILAENRTVIAFDNKGVGLTDGIAPNSFTAMADDAAKFITALGYKQVDVLGFSIGGAVAQELLINHNDLVRRVILASTSVRGGIGVNQMSERSKAVATKETLTDDDMLYAFFAPSQTSRNLGTAFLERTKLRQTDKDVAVSKVTAKAQATARDDWGRPQEKPDERLKKITNAILIANGKDDIRMPTINSYTMFGIAANAQLILYPDSGHGFLFQYAKQVGNTFANFLDQ